MKTIIAAALSFILASCATRKPEPLVVAPTAPPKAVPVAPAAVEVRAGVRDGSVAAERLEVQVDGMRRTAAGLRETMQRAVDEAARLREAKTATEAEIDALWKMLSNSNDHAKNLFDEVERSKATAADLRAKLATAEKSVEDLIRIAANKDAEADGLRLQNADLVKALDSSVRAHETTKRALSKAEGDAALGSYIKAMGWVIVIAAILIAAAKLFMPPFPLKS
jgi:predicted RNase H-like nuclease (RuvC/YqgF family)